MTLFIQKNCHIILLGLSITLTSCIKSYDYKDKEDLAFKTEVLGEEEIISLSTSNYETQITSSLEHTNGSDSYTKGHIEYWIKNNLVASINFGDGSVNNEASLITGSTTTTINLVKQNSGSKYNKVIVTPIIKTDDCTYIVQGIIKYYNIETGELVATIDFGDGTCDELATKTWPSGNYGGKSWTGGSKVFNMNDWIVK